MPHDPVEDLKPANAVESYAVEAIDGEKQEKGHVNVHPHQLDEILLPKAIDYLYHNAEDVLEIQTWQCTPKCGEDKASTSSQNHAAARHEE